MICALECHQGDREVQRLRTFHSGDTMITGCLQCTDQYLHNLFPTEKRTRVLPNGKEFKISAAHVRDIKRRRVSPDLSSTWTDRKGLGSDMRY